MSTRVQGRAAARTTGERSALRRPTVLAGRYRLIERVGAGGMATIFRARDDKLERDVAVKLLHAHLAHDPDLRGRFRTEARHAARLVHPHIVNVFDQGVAAPEDLDDPFAVNGLPYIVMEYVDGPSLRDVLTDRGRLQPAEALAVIPPICAGLARAHEAGVVHRDVKPENVLVASDGTVKVADFGIARALATTRHTATGTLVGSVNYMAPELVDGGDPSPASDQYAVGVVLFELVTGRKPLPAETPMAIALRHSREALPAPSDLVDDCPPALDDVVSRATAHDPRRRYPDLTALATALLAAVGDDPQPVTVAGPQQDQTLVIPAGSQDTISLGGAADLDERSPARRATTRGLISGLIAIAALAAVAGSGWALWNFVLAAPTEVPDLAGLSRPAAAETLEEHGLRPVLAAAVNNRQVPEGAIVSQDPESGATLRRGGTVTLVPSAGPREVPMPDVTGMTREDAIAALEGDPHFYTVRVVEAYSDTVPAGSVQVQAPAAGRPLEQGAEASINVSLGPEQVDVPDVVGMDRSAAEAALADAGLRASVTEEYRDDEPEPGRVAAQSPDGDATVDRGSTVTVTLSLGPATLEVPDVRGRSVDDASQRLRDAGFEVALRERSRPRLGPFPLALLNRVQEQSPQPGAAADRGATIELTVYTREAERDAEGGERGDERGAERDDERGAERGDERGSSSGRGNGDADEEDD